VKRFVKKRKESLPPYSPPSAFGENYYRLSLNTDVPPSEAGKVIEVGQEVSV